MHVLVTNGGIVTWWRLWRYHSAADVTAENCGNRSWQPLAKSAHRLGAVGIFSAAAWRASWFIRRTRRGLAAARQPLSSIGETMLTVAGDVAFRSPLRAENIASGETVLALTYVFVNRGMWLVLFVTAGVWRNGMSESRRDVGATAS